jgi:hypothetical protein
MSTDDRSISRLEFFSFAFVQLELLLASAVSSAYLRWEAAEAAELRHGDHHPKRTKCQQFPPSWFLPCDRRTPSPQLATAVGRRRPRCCRPTSAGRSCFTTSERFAEEENESFELSKVSGFRRESLLREVGGAVGVAKHSTK